MPPKKQSISDELLECLLDERVIEALATNISKIVAESIDEKLTSICNKFQAMERNQEAATASIKSLQDENSVLRERLDDLDAYSRGDNLVFHGIAASSFSDAVSSANANGGSLGRAEGGSDGSSFSAGVGVLTSFSRD